LSADGVRRELLDGLNASRAELDAAVDRCVGGSLLTWSLTGDALVIHRLLARVLRERDQADGRYANTLTAALDLLVRQPHFVL
jgi:hypothetical protein